MAQAPMALESHSRGWSTRSSCFIWVALLAQCVTLGTGFDIDPGNDGEPETYCTPQLLSRYPGGWPSELDMGIYWFGHGDATEKAVSGSPSQFYDPSKKTVIYFHGWAGDDQGWTEICKRATTRCPSDVCRGTTHTLLMERWLDDGWNVGFFYWDQFADEDCTRDAEQKIWFDRQGDGFRWKSFDIGSHTSEYKVYGGDANSIADMCMENVMMAMGQYSGHQVRFVGHSIGAQLAVRCAAMLHERGSVAAPQRLALLEPYFSKHHLWVFRCKDISTDSGLGDFTSAATAVYVKSLWEDYKVVTEVYKSSVMTENKAFGVPNEDLERQTVVVKYEPHWCGGLGALGNLNPLANLDIMHLSCHHLAVFPMYFLSYGQPSPQVIPAQLAGQAQPGSAISTCGTPSAICTDGQIREWVERQIAVEGRQVWTQAQGEKTITSSDDAYKLEPTLEDEAQLDPGGSANLLVMKTAMTSKDIFDELHKVPWWRNPHSGRLQVILLSLCAALVGLIGGALMACRHSAAGADFSDDDSESELARSSLSGLKASKLASSSSSLQLAGRSGRSIEVQDSSRSTGP